MSTFRYRGVGSAPHFIQPIQNDWSPVAGVTASAAPAAACVEQFLAASKRAFTLSTLAPNLDLESFGWRFFDPQGPRHLMLSIDGATKGWLLLTVGPRRGVNVCRIITMLSDTRAGYELLLTAARKTARTLGADILLYFHASPLLAAVLRCGGLAPIKNSPLTFLYSRKRAFPFEEIGFDGAAGDFGLEGIVPGDLR